MPFLPYVWQSIQDQVHSLGEHLVDETNALQLLLERMEVDPHAVVLFDTPILWDEWNPKSLSRCGDILLGFIASEKTELELQIADTRKYVVHLEPGRFAYALDNMHCIPMINLAFHDVRVTATDGAKENVRAVYALLASDDRRMLCLEGCGTGLVQYFPDYVNNYKSGMLSRCTGKEDGEQHVMPVLTL